MHLGQSLYKWATISNKVFFSLPLNKVSHFSARRKRPLTGTKRSLWISWRLGLTFGSEVQMIFYSSLTLFQLVGQLSVLPTCRPNQFQHRQTQKQSEWKTVLQTTTRFIVLLYLSTDLCSQHQPFFMLSINPSLCGRAEAGCLILSGIFNFFLIKGCLSRATWHREKQFEVSQ